MRQACRRVRESVRLTRTQHLQWRPTVGRHSPADQSVHRREAISAGNGRHCSRSALQDGSQPRKKRRDERRNRPKVAEMAIDFRGDLSPGQNRDDRNLQKPCQIREPHSCRKPLPAMSPSVISTLEPFCSGRVKSPERYRAAKTSLANCKSRDATSAGR